MRRTKTVFLIKDILLKISFNVLFLSPPPLPRWGVFFSHFLEK
jgi:hypothetical protein